MIMIVGGKIKIIKGGMKFENYKIASREYKEN